MLKSSLHPSQSADQAELFIELHKVRRTVKTSLVTGDIENRLLHCIACTALDLLPLMQSSVMVIDARVSPIFSQAARTSSNP